MKINNNITTLNHTFKSTKNKSENKTRPINNTMSESRYNQIAAISGLGVLASLGIALTYIMKPHNNTGNKKLKKYIKPAIRQVYNSIPTPTYYGPTVSCNSISKSWNNYISTIEQRIDSYHCNNYEKVFIRNNKKLDKLEKAAEAKIIDINSVV